MNKLSSYRNKVIPQAHLEINSECEIEEFENFKNLIAQQISNASLITSHIEKISTQNLIISKEIQDFLHSSRMNVTQQYLESKSKNSKQINIKGDMNYLKSLEEPEVNAILQKIKEYINKQNNEIMGIIENSQINQCNNHKLLDNLKAISDLWEKQNKENVKIFNEENIHNKHLISNLESTNLKLSEKVKTLTNSLKKSVSEIESLKHSLVKSESFTSPIVKPSNIESKLASILKCEAQIKEMKNKKYDINLKKDSGFRQKDTSEKNKKGNTIKNEEIHKDYNKIDNKIIKEDLFNINRLKNSLIVEFKQTLSNHREALGDIINSMKEKFNSILPYDKKLISFISNQLRNLESILSSQIINYSSNSLSNQSDLDYKNENSVYPNLSIIEGQYKKQLNNEKPVHANYSDYSEKSDQMYKNESSDYSKQMTPLKEEYEKMKKRVQEMESSYSVSTKNKNEEIIKLSDKFSSMQKQYQGIIDKLKAKEANLKKELARRDEELIELKSTKKNRENELYYKKLENDLNTQRAMQTDFNISIQSYVKNEKILKETISQLKASIYSKENENQKLKEMLNEIPITSSRELEIVWKRSFDMITMISKTLLQNFAKIEDRLATKENKLENISNLINNLRDDLYLKRKVKDKNKENRDKEYLKNISKTNSRSNLTTSLRGSNSKQIEAESKRIIEEIISNKNSLILSNQENYENKYKDLLKKIEFKDKANVNSAKQIKVLKEERKEFIKKIETMQNNISKLNEKIKSLNIKCTKNKSNKKLLDIQIDILKKFKEEYLFRTSKLEIFDQVSNISIIEIRNSISKFKFEYLEVVNICLRRYYNFSFFNFNLDITIYNPNIKSKEHSDLIEKYELVESQNKLVRKQNEDFKIKLKSLVKEKEILSKNIKEIENSNHLYLIEIEKRNYSNLKLIKNEKLYDYLSSTILSYYFNNSKQSFCLESIRMTLEDISSKFTSNNFDHSSTNIFIIINLLLQNILIQKEINNFQNVEQNNIVNHYLNKIKNVDLNLRTKLNEIETKIYTLNEHLDRIKYYFGERIILFNQIKASNNIKAICEIKKYIKENTQLLNEKNESFDTLNSQNKEIEKLNKTISDQSIQILEIRNENERIKEELIQKTNMIDKAKELNLKSIYQFKSVMDDIREHLAFLIKKMGSNSEDNEFEIIIKSFSDELSIYFDKNANSNNSENELLDLKNIIIKLIDLMNNFKLILNTKNSKINLLIMDRKEKDKKEKEFVNSIEKLQELTNIISLKNNELKEETNNLSQTDLNNKIIIKNLKNQLIMEEDKNIKNKLELDIKDSQLKIFKKKILEKFNHYKQNLKHINSSNLELQQEFTKLFANNGHFFKEIQKIQLALVKRKEQPKTLSIVSEIIISKLPSLDYSSKELINELERKNHLLQDLLIKSENIKNETILLLKKAQNESLDIFNSNQSLKEDLAQKALYFEFEKSSFQSIVKKQKEDLDSTIKEHKDKFIKCLNQKDERIIFLENKNNEISEEITKFMKENLILKEENQSIKENLDLENRNQQNIKMLENEFQLRDSQKNKEMDDISLKYQESLELKKKNEVELFSLRNHIKEDINQITLLKMQINDIENKEKRKNLKLLKSIKNLKKEIFEIKNKLKFVIEEFANIKFIEKIVKENINNFQLSIKTVIGNIESSANKFSIDLKIKDKQIKKFTKLLKELQDKENIFSIKNANLNEDYANKILEFNNKIESYSEKLNKINLELQNEKNINTNLIAQLNESKLRTEQIEKEIENYKKAKENYEQEIMKLASDKEISMQKEKDNIQKYLNQIDELSLELEANKNESDSLLSKNNDLNKIIEKITQENLFLHDKINIFQEEMEQIKQKLSREKEEESNKLNNTINYLQKSLNVKERQYRFYKTVQKIELKEKKSCIAIINVQIKNSIYLFKNQIIQKEREINNYKNSFEEINNQLNKDSITVSGNNLFSNFANVLNNLNQKIQEMSFQLSILESKLIKNEENNELLKQSNQNLINEILNHKNTIQNTSQENIILSDQVNQYKNECLIKDANYFSLKDEMNSKLQKTDEIIKNLNCTIQEYNELFNNEQNNLLTILNVISNRKEKLSIQNLNRIIQINPLKKQITLEISSTDNLIILMENYYLQNDIKTIYDLNLQINNGLTNQSELSKENQFLIDELKCLESKIDNYNVTFIAQNNNLNVNELTLKNVKNESKICIETFIQLSFTPYNKGTLQVINLNENINVQYLKSMSESKFQQIHMRLAEINQLQNQTKIGELNIFQESLKAENPINESIQTFDLIEIKLDICKAHELHFDFHSHTDERIENIEAMIHLQNETWFACKNNNNLFWINSNKLSPEYQDKLLNDFLTKYELCESELKNILQLLATIKNENVLKIQQLIINFYSKKCECRNVASKLISNQMENPYISQKLTFSNTQINFNIEFENKSPNKLFWFKTNEEMTAFKKTFIEFSCIVHPNQKEIEPLLKTLISMMNLSFEEINNIEHERSKKKEKAKGLFNWWS